MVCAGTMPFTGIVGDYQDLGLQAENVQFRVLVIILAWIPRVPSYNRISKKHQRSLYTDDFFWCA